MIYGILILHQAGENHFQTGSVLVQISYGSSANDVVAYLTVLLSSVLNLNSAAFLLSWANLSSNLDTFLRTGFTNLPLRSVTFLVSSLISKSLTMTFISMSYLADSISRILLWYSSTKVFRASVSAPSVLFG